MADTNSYAVDFKLSEPGKMSIKDIEAAVSVLLSANDDTRNLRFSMTETSEGGVDAVTISLEPRSPIPTEAELQAMFWMERENRPYT